MSSKKLRTLTPFLPKAPERQLISYIAPGAPATRRPAHGDEAYLRPEIGFTPAWYRQYVPVDFGARWHNDVSYRRSMLLVMREVLKDHFSGTNIGQIDEPQHPLDCLTGVYGGCLIPACFGWNIHYAADNWPTVEPRYLTREQMKSLKKPDLDHNPFLDGLMRQIDQIVELEGTAIGFVNSQGVINIAQRLRGADVFVDLYEERDACKRFFGIICEVILEITMRIRQRQRNCGVNYDFVTVSNCSVNMLSGDHYKDFLLPFDRRIGQTFQSTGIHNCAWRADPYLEYYANLERVGYIDMGLESDLIKARALFPNARRALMYTPMDLANKSKQQLTADFRRIAHDYGPCDIVLADIEAGMSDQRVRLAVELCKQLGRKYESGSPSL